MKGVGERERKERNSREKGVRFCINSFPPHPRKGERRKGEREGRREGKGRGETGEGEREGTALSTPSHLI